MSDDYDYFKCDTCKKRLKEPVILRNSKKICKSHLEPGDDDFIIDVKFNNYLNGLDHMENLNNNIQNLCQEYQSLRENILKKLNDKKDNKISICKKIHYLNLNQELKGLNQENSKFNDTIYNIIKANEVDIKKINELISKNKSFLNFINAVNKLSTIEKDANDLYNEINLKLRSLRNISLSEPKYNITLQTSNMIINDPFLITCCCLDRLQPIIYFVI
jgi:hypothetical protein